MNELHKGQMMMLEAVISHFDIKQKKNKSDEEFMDTLLFFKKNLQSYTDFEKQQEEMA